MLNIGRKDEHGRQGRIEHRGRHLRASRTGGVALRTQTKMAGVNFTANTNRGVRISTSVGPGTQVALQNGRFVLRGRYGAGPLRFNLSKSGLTMSAKNRLGAFNLSNPNRSSAKIGGIQLRGEKAASIQVIYLMITIPFQLLRLFIKAAVVLGKLLWLPFNVLWRLFDVLLKILTATAGWCRGAMRTLRNGWIRYVMHREAVSFSKLPDDEEGLKMALTLIYEGWGRGRSAGTLVEEQKFKNIAHSVATTMDAVFNGVPTEERTLDAAMGYVADRLRRCSAPESLPEIMLAMDDRALEEAPRTRRQARMLEVFSDFAGVRLAVGDV